MTSLEVLYPRDKPRGQVSIPQWIEVDTLSRNPLLAVRCVPLLSLLVHQLSNG